MYINCVVHVGGGVHAHVLRELGLMVSSSVALHLTY